MCHIFAGQDPASYRCRTRSIRLGGHVTSIRLEQRFWSILEDISAAQGLSLGKFLSTLYDEALEIHGTVTNFTSLLRCACLLAIQDAGKTLPDATADASIDANADASISANANAA